MFSLTSPLVGYIGAAVAVVCFGSNFVPVKKFESGDGLYFQWLMSVGIWVFGAVVYMLNPTGMPLRFYPLGAVGGMLWCCGNVLAVPVIKRIGIGLGLCLWSSTSLVVGWASGRFGLFGFSDAEPVLRPGLNYLGVGLAGVAIALFMLVQPDDPPPSPPPAHLSTPHTPASGVMVEGSPQTPQVGYPRSSGHRVDDPRAPLLPQTPPPRGVPHPHHPPATAENATSCVVNVDPNRVGDGDPGSGSTSTTPASTPLDRVVGVVLAVVSGVFYGVNFSPVQAIIDTSCTGVVRGGAHHLALQVAGGDVAVAVDVVGEVAATTFISAGNSVSGVDVTQGALSPLASRSIVRSGLQVISTPHHLLPSTPTSTPLPYPSPGRASSPHTLPPTTSPVCFHIPNEGINYTYRNTTTNYAKCCGGASAEELDYVLSHFTGILITATLFFAVYCVVRRNSPYVNSQLTLPAMASGVMWAMAQVGWFIANSALSMAIAYPLIAAGPGLVAQLWGVIYFKEVTSKRSLLALAGAFVFILGCCP